jgi:hypothetical protein
MGTGNRIMDPAVDPVNSARPRIHDDAGMMNHVNSGGFGPQDRFSGFRALLHPEVPYSETDAVIDN